MQEIQRLQRGATKIGIRKSRWIRCPLCGHKSRTKVYENTVLETLQAALSRMVDTSKANVFESLLEEFVETVVPVENYRYRWKLSFENQSSGFHSDLLFPCAPPVISFTIDFETAREYRETCQMATQFRKCQWHDLEVEVYF